MGASLRGRYDVAAGPPFSLSNYRREGLVRQGVVPLTREISTDRGSTLIEWLKVELVGGTSDLMRGILRQQEELILDSLAQIVLSCFLMARRLGLGFRDLDRRVEEKVQAHLHAGHEAEHWHGDFSAYLHHVQCGRKEREHAQPPGTSGSLA